MTVQFLSHRAGAVLLTLAITGCVNLPADRGWDASRAALSQRAPEVAQHLHDPSATAPHDATHTAVDTLLAAPLTADTAIRVALLAHPNIRIEYAKLGIAQADWLDASQPSNPVFSATRLDSDAPGGGDIRTFGLMQNLGELLFRHSAAQVADDEIAIARLSAAATIHTMATDVAHHWYDAAAAVEMARVHEASAETARASAALAARFHAAGNISQLALSQHQQAAHAAHIALADAKAAAAVALLALNQAMGLAAPVRWDIAPLPARATFAASTEELLETGRTQRLDLAIASRRIDNLQRTVKLARTLRWIPFLEVGIEREREPDGTRLQGPTIAIELPLFGRNRSPLLRAEAALEQAIAEKSLLDADISNAIVTAHTGASHAAAKIDAYLSDLIPVQQQILEEMQLQQNYMLTGPFELLTAKQTEFSVCADYVEALRQFWQQYVALGVAVGSDVPTRPVHQHETTTACAQLAAPSNEPHTDMQHTPAVHDHGGHH